MVTTLNKLGHDFLVVSQEHGFTNGSESMLHVTEKLMLVVSELAEALEELRTGNEVRLVYFKPDRPTKPEGFSMEIADALIRLLQLCAALEIDIDKAVALKNQYNITRPFKHGKQF